MFSEVSICRVALSRVGSTVKIASLDDRTAAAIECKQAYEMHRDKVLAAVDWPFAGRVADLQLTGTGTGRWLYRYQYPNDCVAVRYVTPPLPDGMSNASYREWLQRYRFAHEIQGGDSDNLTILSDIEQAVIHYTRRVTNPVLFSAAFASMLAWAIAAEVAIPLAKGEYAANAAAHYEKELGEAAAKAMSEEVRDEALDSEFVTCRY